MNGDGMDYYIGKMDQQSFLMMVRAVAMIVRINPIDTGIGGDYYIDR
jgi:hypothetical protein